MATMEFLSDLVLETFKGLMSEVASGKIELAEDVREYVDSMAHSEIAKSISEAVCSHVELLAKNSDNLSSLNLREFEGGLATTKQGVYANVITSAMAGPKIYVGSSWGKRGLEARTKDHQNPIFREKYKHVYHYMLLNTPGNIANFFPLVVFPSKVPMALVVCAEAVMACVLGAFPRLAYMAARPRHLPRVDYHAAVNRMDPLLSGDSTLTAKVGAREKHQWQLENALQGGPKRIFPCKNRTSVVYRWNLLGATLTFPTAVAREWGLDQSPSINVRYDILDGRHPNAWSPKSTDDDDGRRLGIEASKMVDGEERSIWLHNSGELAPKMANSIFDWLEGRIEDPDTHIWAESRIPFCGPRAVLDDARAKRQEDRRKGRQDESAPAPKRRRPAEELPTEEPRRKQPRAWYEEENEEDVIRETEEFMFKMHMKYLAPWHREMRRQGINMCSIC